MGTRLPTGLNWPGSVVCWSAACYFACPGARVSRRQSCFAVQFADQCRRKGVEFYKNYPSLVCNGTCSMFSSWCCSRIDYIVTRGKLSSPVD